MSMTINVTGRIGKDAEVKATPQGVIIIESSLASNEYNSKEKKMKQHGSSLLCLVKDMKS